ncbi:hypothetical protein EMCRGX_G035061 [Ephydatia muelleri]
MGQNVRCWGGLVPLEVETFGNWGKEAQGVFTRLASHLQAGVSDEQAQVSLKYGGLGLGSVSFHSCAAYIASVCATVSPEDTVTLDSIVSSPVHQRTLSSCLDLQCFMSLLNASSLANKAHLLSVSAPHASSWLTVVPTVELGVHLDPSELGVHLDPSELGVHLDPSELGVHLDPSELGVHLDPSWSHLGAKDEEDVEEEEDMEEEADEKLAVDGDKTIPGHDQQTSLLPIGICETSAAFDITVASPVKQLISWKQDVSAKAAEHRKHTENDPKCVELGWRCIPLAVESYGFWDQRH